MRGLTFTANTGLFKRMLMTVGLPFPDWLQPTIFSIGPMPIRWYALAYIAGLLLGWRYVVYLTRRDALWRPAGAGKGGSPISDKMVDDVFIWAVLGVILGGRLGYVLFYKPNLIWENPLQILMTWEGGMAFHGGLIGVSLAVWLFARARGIPVLRFADLFAAATPIGLFFGRIANFINGELWGRVTDVPWAVRFPSGGYLPRHPSQLYEAVMEGLILFAVTAFMTLKRDSLTRPGLNTGIFLAGYGLARTLVETVRVPDAHMPDFPLGLTMGMFLSLPMIAVGAWLIRRAYRTPPAKPA